MTRLEILELFKNHIKDIKAGRSSGITFLVRKAYDGTGNTWLMERTFDSSQGPEYDFISTIDNELADYLVKKYPVFVDDWRNG